MLCDADPQGSLLTWADRAAELEVEVPPVFGVGDSLHKQIPEAAADYDVVIVDTPGDRGTRMATALMIADVALIPVQPGAQDVWTLPRTMEAVTTANSYREAAGLPELTAAVVCNGTVRTMLSGSTVDTLTEMEIPMLKTRVGRRTAIANAIAAGQGVTAYEPGSVASMEVRALADELGALLGLEVRHAEAS